MIYPSPSGVLAATQQVWPDKLEGVLFLGELSLDGTTRHTKGILPMAALARSDGFKQVFVPAVDAEEAALMPDIEVVAVESLSHLAGHLTGLKLIEPYTLDIEDAFGQDAPYLADFADIMGQEHVKRAMEVSAAGGHNLIRFWATSRNIQALIPKI